MKHKTDLSVTNRDITLNSRAQKSKTLNLKISENISNIINPFKSNISII